MMNNTIKGVVRSFSREMIMIADPVFKRVCDNSQGSFFLHGKDIKYLFIKHRL